MTNPTIKITGLEIKGLKAIHHLLLPQDGLGWKDLVPDIVLFGGANGSGKTTLLEYVFQAFHFLSGEKNQNDFELLRGNGWIDFHIETESEPVHFEFVSGTQEFLHNRIELNNSHSNISQRFMLSFEQELTYMGNDPILQFKNAIRSSRGWNTGILYFPSIFRTLVTVEETYKSPGDFQMPEIFAYRWSPPAEWKRTAEAILYSARWRDLNAKESGEQPQGYFQEFSQEFHELTNHEKTLTWEKDAQLMVKTKSGAYHSLNELSSGEKQMLLLLTELRWRWRQRNAFLILIDEPELHLHSSWQTYFYLRIKDLQRKFGGQVWLATQSEHLFEIADHGTKCILGMKKSVPAESWT